MYDGKWLDVPHTPGGVVVNLGTVLSHLTGGRWKAAIHRATRVGRGERLSMVIGALVPPNDLPLECLPGLCTDARPSSKTPPSVKEYLDARVRLQRPEKKSCDQDVVDFIDKLA